MFNDFVIVQILKIEEDSNINPYVVRYIGTLTDFMYDFRSKNSIKKFFDEKNMKSGEYLVLHENEYNGDKYVVDCVLNYRKKSSGNFLEMCKPGKAWIELVRNAMEQYGKIPMRLEVRNAKSINVPVVAM